MSTQSTQNLYLFVDKDYRLLQCSPELLQAPATEGQRCYERLQGRSAPCPECVLLKGGGRGRCFYKGFGWGEASAQEMTLPVLGEGYMINWYRTADQAPQTQAQDVQPVITLPSREEFFRQVEICLRHTLQTWYLLAVDIDHFKLFNQWYGTAAGDELLGDLAQVLRKSAASCGGVAGYMGNDDFAMLLQGDKAEVQALHGCLNQCVQRYNGDIGFTPAMGAYPVESDIPAAVMYDCALTALTGAKGNYYTRISWYDPAEARRIEAEHLLLTEVQDGLEKSEFIVYTQPQCNMLTGRIVGMEALVRWCHPVRGIVAPGVFIPVLEKNGLISRLDTYLWEKVAMQIHEWIIAGENPVPVSVNISRMDIYSLDVVQYFDYLIKKYELPRGSLEAEITESAYAEDFDRITAVVEGLQSLGVPVLMDDFGSGYSSLNMLREIRVDVLKLDIKLLQIGGENAERGYGILEAIISMAHMLGLRVIAEGVETPAQRKLLLDLDCHYGQGYYYYRPMPCSDASLLLRNPDNVDYRGVCGISGRYLNVRELLSENFANSAMVNNILGGVAIYRLRGDKVFIDQVNAQYSHVTGSDVQNSANGANASSHIYPSDRSRLLEAFATARVNLAEGAVVEVRRLGDDNVTRWLRIRVYFLRTQGDEQLFYGALEDITANKRQQERQIAQARKASSAEEESADLPPEQSVLASTLLARAFVGGLFRYCPVTRGTADYVSPSLASMLGYASPAEAVKRKRTLVHPDDIERIKNCAGPELYEGLTFSTNCRLARADGGWHWVMCYSEVFTDEAGRHVVLNACSDLSGVEVLNTLQSEQNALLLRQNQELNFLINYMPVGYYRAVDEGDGHASLSYVSKRFLDTVGYSRAELTTLFGDEFLRMVYPDDRERVRANAAASPLDTMLRLQYRISGKDGPVWVLDQRRVLVNNGRRMVQGTLTNVDADISRMQWLQMLQENAPSDIIRLTLVGGQVHYDVFALGNHRRVCGDQNATAEHLRDYLRTSAYQNQQENTPWGKIREQVSDALKNCRDYRTVFMLRDAAGQSFPAQFICNFISRDHDEITYLCFVYALDAPEQ